MPLFNLTTEYTENIIIKYCTRHILSKKGFLISFFILIPLGIVATSLYLFLIGYNQIISFLLVLFIALGIMIPLSWYFIPRKTVKRQSNIIGAKQNYEFFEDELKVTSVSGSISKENTLPYPAFLFILEAKDAYYFYPDKNQAYILDISTLNEKELSEFKTFIYSKIENKKIKKV